MSSAPPTAPAAAAALPIGETRDAPLPAVASSSSSSTASPSSSSSASSSSSSSSSASSPAGNLPESSTNLNAKNPASPTSVSGPLNVSSSSAATAPSDTSPIANTTTSSNDPNVSPSNTAASAPAMTTTTTGDDGAAAPPTTTTTTETAAPASSSAQGGSANVELVTGDPPAAPVSYKLFVGQVPRLIRQEDLFALFAPFGEVQEIFILRDPHTGMSKGCCFVRYRTREAAEMCIATLHNRMTLPDAGNPLQISFASPKDHQQSSATQTTTTSTTTTQASSNPGGTSPPISLNPLETKLFVGQIPTSAKDEDLRAVFERYGEVREVHIMRHRDTGNSKSAGFVRFADPQAAKRAIAEISGKVTMEGGVGPLRVDFALPHTPAAAAHPPPSLHPNVAMNAGMHHHPHHPLSHGGMMLPPPPSMAHQQPPQQQPPPQQQQQSRVMNGGRPPNQAMGNNPYMAMGAAQPHPHLGAGAQSMQYSAGWYPTQLPLPPPPPPPPPHPHAMDARGAYLAQAPPPHMDQSHVMMGMKGGGQAQPHHHHHPQHHQPQAMAPHHPGQPGMHPQGPMMVSPAMPLQKLFVGGLTAQTTENQLFQVFSHYGNVREVVVLRYPNGQSKLSGFVKFATEHEATLSAVSLDSRYTLPGSPRPMTVRYAGSNNQPPEHKLFVGHLPQHYEETDTEALFQQYGDVLEVFVMRDTRGATKGSAFVKFARRESAQAAIDALNGSTNFGDRPLKVAFAHSRTNVGGSGNNNGNASGNNSNNNSNASTSTNNSVGNNNASTNLGMGGGGASASHLNGGAMAPLLGPMGGQMAQMSQLGVLPQPQQPPSQQYLHIQGQMPPPQHAPNQAGGVASHANVVAQFQFPEQDFGGGVEGGGSPYFYPAYTQHQQQSQSQQQQQQQAHLVSDLTQ